jgi:hypothetical protein
MKNMYKRAKMDIGLVSQAINNTNVTGKYFGLQMFRKALFALIGGAMAATTTTKLEILQAKDAAGTDAKAIADASATITANELATEATVALVAAAATDKVTVNGVIFTMAAATDAAKKEFADAAGLVTCIKAAVDGVTASADGTTVTVESANPGEKTVTVVGENVAGTVTVATTKAQGYVEVDAGSLDLAGGFEYVAVKVTTTANTVAGVVLLRGDGRFEPDQAVGAGAAV